MVASTAMPRSKKMGAAWANTRRNPLSAATRKPSRSGNVLLALRSATNQSQAYQAQGSRNPTTRGCGRRSAHQRGGSRSRRRRFGRRGRRRRRSPRGRWARGRSRRRRHRMRPFPWGEAWGGDGGWSAARGPASGGGGQRGRGEEVGGGQGQGVVGCRMMIGRLRVAPDEDARGRALWSRLRRGSDSSDGATAQAPKRAASVSK